MKSKFKRILSIVVLACCMLSFSGCGPVSMEDAEWEGYEGMPFKEFLQEGLEGWYKEWEHKGGDYVRSVKVTCEEDWPRSKMEDYTKFHYDRITNPVTYTATVYMSEGYAKFTFFAELDDKVVIRSSISYESGVDWIEEKTASEACEFLYELERYVD